ncbi:30S ribosomal protein S8e [Candidatus Micrarchaeota archaeon]|nr:30S ribosomal protein S8e [Candidatus Micrarchaeota archaeon]
MYQYHEARTKKVSSGTGGRRKKRRDKKLAHLGRRFTSTKVGEKTVREILRVKGGLTKQRLKKAVFVNVRTKDGMKKTKILGVIESHRADFTRENIITKGAIIKTDIGQVKVTNRVGQDGIVNGVLIG